MRAYLCSLAFAFTLIGCSSEPDAPNPSIGAWGFDLTTMDKAVKPGDDFFRYANGVWLDSFEIPADRSRYGAFDQLAEAAEKDVHAIIDELAASNPAPGSVERKVGDFYKSWMDEEKSKEAHQVCAVLSRNWRAGRT